MLKQIFLLAAIFSQFSYAADASNCKSMTQNEARLACYDELHGYQTKESTEPTVEQSTAKRSVFSLLPHKQSYFMPISYNSSRRPLSDLTDDITAPELDDLEVKFQISFKLVLWDEIFGKNTQLMTAYTQKSFWQMYNSEASSPFRETNYEPEIFITKNTDVELFGINLINTKLGFVHQSNGRSHLYSRSWNRIYADFIFQKNNFALSIKPWWRTNEDIEEDDNPDIEDYLGKYEIGMVYQWRDSEFTALVRNIGGRKHQASFQLGWLYPLNDQINFYVEYFHGYGESLIDYDHMNQSIGIGFTINDWID